MLALDLTTNNGKVRGLISDLDESQPIFPYIDYDVVDMLLELNRDNVKRAAANALLIIASNEVLTQKVIRLLDLSTNGASEAQVLKDLAAQYRREAEEEATGTIDWLDLPEGLEQFDKRSNDQWSKVLRDRRGHYKDDDDDDHWW